MVIDSGYFYQVNYFNNKKFLIYFSAEKKSYGIVDTVHSIISEFQFLCVVVLLIHIIF
jgi:hypothetical protein